MTNCTPETVLFPVCRKRRIEAAFDGGDVTSNGGVLLLRQADRRLGLTAAVARRLGDRRQRGKVRHRFVDMLRQRVFAIALGYEDLNDHTELRHDVAVQTATGRTGRWPARRRCAASRTRPRRAGRGRSTRSWRMPSSPRMVIRQPRSCSTSMPRTTRFNGHQEGRFFHGYYDHYCFLPLYVFAGDHLLAAYLRRSDIDPAKHAGAVLKLLVRRLRLAWPAVRIIVRADSGFCRWRMLSWCERHGVDYIIGLARNKRREALAAPVMAQARALFATTGDKQRHFAELRYGAGTWNRERRVHRAPRTDRPRRQPALRGDQPRR